MCLHDHDAGAVAPPAAVTRRNALAGAAVLAGVSAAGVAAVAPSVAASGLRSGADSRRRRPVPGPLVVEGGTLLDPLTGKVVEDAVVVLANGSVLAAGTRDATRGAVAAVRSRAQRIDAAGSWVLPGLVDSHVHVNALADAAAVLHAGATTARSGSSTFYQDVAMRPLAEWAPGSVPRMRAAGVFVTPELGDTVLADPALAPLAALPDGVQSPSDLRYLTRVNVSRGVDVVKTRANPRAGIAEQDPTELVYDQEQIAAVVSAAGRAGVLCHAYSEAGIDGAVRAGVQSIEHGVFVGEATIARMARKGTYFTPTMAAITGMASSSDPILAERGRQYTGLPARAVRAPSRRPARLDPTQQAVVDHPGGPLLVLAGPGTGKTTTIVEAVAARIEAGVDPEQILVLTFSRKAAAELRTRITGRVAPTIREPLARTFHSYAYGVLRRAALLRGDAAAAAADLGRAGRRGRRAAARRRRGGGRRPLARRSRPGAGDRRASAPSCASCCCGPPSAASAPPGSPPGDRSSGATTGCTPRPSRTSTRGSPPSPPPAGATRRATTRPSWSGRRSPSSTATPSCCARNATGPAGCSSTSTRTPTPPRSSCWSCSPAAAGTWSRSATPTRPSTPSAAPSRAASSSSPTGSGTPTAGPPAGCRWASAGGPARSCCRISRTVAEGLPGPWEHRRLVPVDGTDPGAAEVHVFGSRGGRGGLPRRRPAPRAPARRRAVVADGGRRPHGRRARTAAPRAVLGRRPGGGVRRRPAARGPAGRGAAAQRAHRAPAGVRLRAGGRRRRGRAGRAGRRGAARLAAGRGDRPRPAPAASRACGSRWPRRASTPRSGARPWPPRWPTRRCWSRCPSTSPARPAASPTSSTPAGWRWPATARPRTCSGRCGSAAGWRPGGPGRAPPAGRRVPSPTATWTPWWRCSTPPPGFVDRLPSADVRAFVAHLVRAGAARRQRRRAGGGGGDGPAADRARVQGARVGPRLRGRRAGGRVARPPRADVAARHRGTGRAGLRHRRHRRSTGAPSPWPRSGGCSTSPAPGPAAGWW